jgi:hypothetical protein
MSMLERVNVTLDEQKIGTALHGQEPTTRDVDTVSCGLGVSRDYGNNEKVRTFEVFNRCPAAVSNCESAFRDVP